MNIIDWSIFAIDWIFGKPSVTKAIVATILCEIIWFASGLYIGNGLEGAVAVLVPIFVAFKVGDESY